MIIDIKSMFAGGTALLVAVVMTVMATASKWVAAYITQKTFRMSRNERGMMFGLSNAQAVATLAAVLVGHEIIMDNGERLLNDDVLNGTVVMILFTCIISSIVTEHYAKKFALGDAPSDVCETKESECRPKILIPVANPDNIENLVCFSLLLNSKCPNSELLALSVTTDVQSGRSRMADGKKLLERAAAIAAAADVKVNMVSRYDINVPSGIIHTIKEYDVTDLVLGMHRKGGFLDSFFGSLTNNLLKGTYREVMVTRFMVPVNTIRRITVVVPALSEYEYGFAKWVRQLCHIASEMDCSLHFKAWDAAAEHIKILCDASGRKVSIESTEGVSFSDSMDFTVRREDLLVVVSSRSNSISYDSEYERIPSLINRNFSESSFLILYPEQSGDAPNASFAEPVNC